MNDLPIKPPVPRWIAVLAVLCLALMIWRAYEPGFSARPLEPLPRALDLNAASREELLQIPGVGPAMADAILTRRVIRGRFESLEELDAVPGIGPKTLDKLRPWLTIGPGQPVRFMTEPVEILERKTLERQRPAGPASPTRKINLNTASREELQTLPGIGPKLAERIIAERGQGRFHQVDDLSRVHGIGPKTIAKLRPLVTVE